MVEENCLSQQQYNLMIVGWSSFKECSYILLSFANNFITLTVLVIMKLALEKKLPQATFNQKASCRTNKNNYIFSAFSIYFTYTSAVYSRFLLIRSICFQICRCCFIEWSFSVLATYLQMNLANSCIIVGKKKIN